MNRAGDVAPGIGALPPDRGVSRLIPRLSEMTT